MLKDNHLAILQQAAERTAQATAAKNRTSRSLAESIRAAAAQLPHTTHIEVEVDRLDQIESLLESGVINTLLLDNFSTNDLRKAVQLVRKASPHTLLEASGGVTLETIAAIAATGVDLISVGALTHSVRALDLGLDIHL
jgi:nicotinate-nucleotide pyrophosphorylase (carboxylating)